MRPHLQLHQRRLDQPLYRFHFMDHGLHHDRAVGGGFELHGLAGHGQGAEYVL